MSALSSWSPGKNPISLVDTSERTKYIFSYGVFSFKTSDNALNKVINVFPVPAHPYATIFLFCSYESNNLFWLSDNGSISI